MYEFLKDERGTAAIEYSLFVSLIGMMIIVAIQALGDNLVDAFSSINSAFPSVQVKEDSLNVGLLENF